MAARSIDPGRGDALAVVERIAAVRGWRCDRGDGDVAVEIRGQWCDYRVFVSRHPAEPLLLFACALDARVPGTKAPDIYRLLGMINERLLVGHFDLWSRDGLPAFRHAVLSRAAGAEEIAAVLEIALAECERYYPAFQFAIWGGKTAEEALAAAMIETAGAA